MIPKKQPYTLARYKNSNRKQLRKVWMKLKMAITFSEFVEAVHEAAKLEEAQLKKAKSTEAVNEVTNLPPAEVKKLTTDEIYEDVRKDFIEKVIKGQGRQNIINTVTEFWRKISVSEFAPKELVEVALDKITQLRDDTISDYDLFYLLDAVNDIVKLKLDYTQMLSYLNQDDSALEVKGYYCPNESEDES